MITVIIRQYRDYSVDSCYNQIIEQFNSEFEAQEFARPFKNSFFNDIQFLKG